MTDTVVFLLEEITGVDKLSFNIKQSHIVNKYVYVGIFSDNEAICLHDLT